MGKKTRRTKPAKKGSKVGEGRKQSVVTYVPDTTTFGPTPSPEKVTLFWDWFKTNEPALCNLPHFAMAKRIDAELTKVDPGLAYELCTRVNDDSSAEAEKDQNHLIISGGGIKKHFNAVIEIIRAAPTDLENWRFTAFRDRKCDSDLAFEGKMYPRRNIRYALSKDDREDKIGIWLFLKGFDGDFNALPEHEREFFGQIGYLYLDSILGEYDVEMHIGEVVFNSQSDKFSKQAHPLSALTHDFDGWLSEKIGPKPEGGWSALANLGCNLGIVGTAADEKKSPTSVACDPGEQGVFNDIKDGNGKEGVIGTPPTDERVDLLRELLDGLVTDEGMAAIPNLLSAMDHGGLDK